MYELVSVADDALPDGHTWAIAEAGETTYMILTQAAEAASVAAMVWAAVRVKWSGYVPATRFPSFA